jgi:hypothetical protein
MSCAASTLYGDTEGEDLDISRQKSVPMPAKTCFLSESARAEATYVVCPGQ